MTDANDGVAETSAEPSSSTRESILQAAITILGRDGYQKLTARSVAAEAGTNLALVNYYFGGKQGLLLAVYDALERQRFERQAAMYGAEEEPLSVKWKRAVDFYHQDLQDGFVRIHHELLVQGMSDPVLGERARQRIRTWNEMLTGAAEDHFADLGIDLPPSLMIAALAAFWYGMEQQHLIGMDEDEAPYFELLELIGNWLEEQEKKAEG